MSQGRDDTVAVLTSEWATTDEVAARVSLPGVLHPRQVVYIHLRSAERDGLVESRLVDSPPGCKIKQIREWRLRQ
jgi:hypothetical protein